MSKEEENKLWKEINLWKETAAHYDRDKEYYRDVLNRIGMLIGDDAYIADDGSKSDTPLIAKLPELVYNLSKFAERAITMKSDYDHMRESHISSQQVIANLAIREQELVNKIDQLNDKLRKDEISEYVELTTRQNDLLAIMAESLQTIAENSESRQ